MSDSKLLQSYKLFIDTRLDELSATVKNKIRNEIKVTENLVSDVHDLINFYLNDSEEVKNLQKLIIPLERSLGVIERKTAIDYKNDTIHRVIKECRILAFEKQILEKKIKKYRPSSQSRLYDQVVKGNVKIVKIKNKSEYSHKITFHKIGKFLMYQVWDPKGIVEMTHLPRYPGNQNHPREFKEAQKYITENPDKVIILNYEINDDRDVMFKNGKEWVASFNNIPNFTPTTVMEIGYKKYIFVIKKTEMNKNDKVVFYISTKEIHVVDDKSKKMKKIPKGEYKNVRFDIDSYGNGISYSCNGTEAGTSTCWCPPGSSISALDGFWPTYCIEECNDGYSDICGICSNECSCKCLLKTYPAIRFEWGNSNGGYFCNSEGNFFFDDNNENVSQQICPLTINKAKCWSTADNNKQCCVPDGETTCTNFS